MEGLPEQTCVNLAAALLKALVSLSWHSTLSLSVMWEQIPRMLMKTRMIVDHAHLHQHSRDPVILLVLRRTAAE